MRRLALVADTHAYQAGLPRLLAFFQSRGLTDLACLGDCSPEPFRAWLNHPRQRLYWVYDFYGPELPEATANGMGLEIPGNVFIAHTRALVWTHFKDRIHAYLDSPACGRAPLVLCHGHTHVPSLTHYKPPAYRLLYINDALHPRQFRPRQACLELAADTCYLLVPGAFTIEEGRYPAFSFAVLDPAARRVAMVSLTDLEGLEGLELFGK